MRTVIKKLQRKLGITTIYVTHDQEEALAISDRIAVMKDGSIIQIGSPLEIYKKPTDPFVAGFIGTSNFLDAKVDTSSPENTTVEQTYICNLPLVRDFKGDVLVSIRPEHFQFSDTGLRGTIVLSTFLGDFINYEVQLENGRTIELNEYTKDMDDLRENDSEVFLSFLCNKVSVFDAHTKEVLT